MASFDVSVVIVVIDVAIEDCPEKTLEEDDFSTINFFFKFFTSFELLLLVGKTFKTLFNPISS